MKKEQLKTILKPLIKECIKEVIFEEGILSGIISEVIQGTGQRVLKEAQAPIKEAIPAKQQKSFKRKTAESRKKLLAAINKDAYGGVDVFEGTTPLKEQNSRSSLGSVEAADPGVDISNIPGANMWKHLIK